MDKSIHSTTEPGSDYDAGWNAFAEDGKRLYDKSESFVEGYRDAAADHLKPSSRSASYGYWENGTWWDDLVNYTLEKCPHGTTLPCDECREEKQDMYVNRLLAKAGAVSLAAVVGFAFVMVWILQPQDFPKGW